MAAPRYRNDKTGEEIEFDGTQWVKVPSATPGERAANWLGGVGRNIRQGGTFGWGDEIVAALGALGAGAPGTPGYAQAYQRGQQREQQAQSQFAQQNPGTALASNIFGGLGTGSLIAKALPAAASQVLSNIPRWLQGPAAGAVAGGVAGTGDAPPGERLEGGATGAALGALAGGAVDLIGKYGGKTVNWLVDKYLRGPQRKAKAEVMTALEREGLTPAEAEALVRSYGDDAVLADAGGRVRTLAAGVEAVPEAPRAAYERFLRERHAAQQDELMATVAGATGRSGLTRSYEEALEKARKGVTKPLYDMAHAKPTVLTKPLEEVLHIPEVQRAYRAGHKIAQLEAGKAIPTTSWDDTARAWKNPPTTAEWDWINRGLRSIQDANYRAGKRDVARAYGELRNKILGELDSANPEFAAARAAHASGKQIEEALEAGKLFFREKDDEALKAAFDGFNAPERGAFLNGVVHAIRQRVRAVGKNKDVTTISWLRSPEFQDRMVMLFGDDAAGLVFKKIDALAEKAITKNQLLNQSMTADKTAVREQLAGADLGEATRQLLSGNPMQAMDATRRAFQSKPSVNPAVAAETAKLLLTPVRQWTAPLATQLQSAQLSPFWARRAQGAVPILAPAVVGEQAGLLPQWLDPNFGGPQ